MQPRHRTYPRQRQPHDPTTLADAIIGGLIYRAAILDETMTNAEVRTFIDELMQES